ncbi:MAG: ImmA/IrrE family metallo-endopeptidase [Rhodobacteraceae bacterium]|nr:ImmA/IrrE family metallo-endopeptidase [Paracoccaceae bacterium]
MVTVTNEFSPDYAVPPGWILKDRLESEGISQAEFARRCGRSPKLVSEIISGKAPLEPGTALQFEKVLNVDAGIWLGIESGYRLHRAREAEARKAAASAEWVKAFPVQDLVKRGCFQRPKSDVETVSGLLAFFRVGSVDAWTARYGMANVAYRHSPKFKSGEAALATWLRLGEIAAERQECADFDGRQFEQGLQSIRRLTREPIVEAFRQTMKLCNEAGVALALIQPLPKTALSGAAWWLSPRKAVIQLTARHKSDDQLWFSFFHEAAHILLHSKKGVFIDGIRGNDTEQEIEANEWASNFLVPKPAWDRFAESSPRKAHIVREFADAQGIAPGIVVGMLQHEGLLPWTHLNGLKIRLSWKS